VEKISTLGWLFSSASLVPAVLGGLIALVGLVFFVRPSRRGSLAVAFLSLVPAAVGMLMVYSDAKDFGEIASDDGVMKPQAIVQCVGRGFGTGIASLFGTSVALYVSLLALLRSWKPSRSVGRESPLSSLSGMGPQGFEARVTRGLNAFEPPSRSQSPGVDKSSLDLDDVIARTGVGFVPGSPIDAISAGRANVSEDDDHLGVASEEDDEEIIDVEEIPRN